MSTTIVASGTLGNVPSASGMSNQNHAWFGINSDRWFWFFVDATNTTKVNCYVSSSNDLTTCTWSAIGSNPLSPALSTSDTWVANDGRVIGVAYKDIGSVDVFYIHANTNKTGNFVDVTQAIRVTVTSSAATWGSWINTSSLGASIQANNPDGVAVGINTLNRDWALLGRFNDQRDASGIIATNTDSGASWTSGFGANTIIDNSMANTCNSCALAPLASGFMLGVWDSGQVTATTTNHIFQKSTSATAWPANTALGTIGSAITAQDKNDWALQGVTTGDVHFVRRTGNTAFEHKRYNGTNWTSVAGATIPSSGLTTHLAGSGIGLATDGTDLWMFVIDTDANKNIKYVKWTAATNTWDSSWTTLGSTNTNTKKFICVSPQVGNGQIGVFWTENASTPFAIVGSALVVSGGGGVSGSAATRTGAQGQCVGLKSAASGPFGEAGARAQAINTATRSGASSSQIGGRAQETNTAARSGAAASESGSRAQDVGASARSSTPSSEAGARAQETATTARSAAPASRAGGEAQTSASRTASGISASEAGARAQEVAAKVASGATASRSGGRAQDVGTKASSAGATSRTGAQSQAAELGALTASANSQMGARSQSVGVKAESTGATSRTGGRSQVAGASAFSEAAASRLGTRAQAQSTGAQSVVANAVSSTGARAQCVGVKRASLDNASRAGARSTQAGAKKGVATTATRTGCTAVAVGSGARIGVAGGREGARGLATSGVAPVVPTGPNDFECVTDAVLPDHVVWPAGVARTYTYEGDAIYVQPLQDCPAPVGSLKPWEI